MRLIGHEFKYCQKFYEIHETVHSVYLVIEHFSGGELLEKISLTQRIKQKHVKSIMRNLMLGLAYIHSLGVMHRDLKPENLMIKGKKISEVRIIDFGLATFVDEEEHLYKRCGTPGFVAPEIINHGQDKKYDEKCDIFSAGIIFHILLCGQSPFHSSNYKKILKLNKLCEIDFGVKGLNKRSSNCLELLKGMLAKDAKERMSAIDCLKHEYFSEVLETDGQVQRMLLLYNQKYGRTKP